MQCSYTIEKWKEIYSNADNSERIENHCVWVLRQVEEEGHGENRKFGSGTRFGVLGIKSNKGQDYRR